MKKPLVRSRGGQVSSVPPRSGWTKRGNVGAEVVEGPAARGQEVVDHVERLGARQRADGVRQRAAGSHQGGGAAQQAPLQVGQAVDVRGAAAPAQVGARRQRAEAGARASSRTASKAPSCSARQLESVADHDLDPDDAQSLQGGAQVGGAALVASTATSRPGWRAAS